MTSEALGERDGLPEALRLLADELPRSSWSEHPRFRGLAEFWLHKHLSFRHLSTQVITDLQAGLDGQMDPRQVARRVYRSAGMLIGGLHDHHGIEDHHYFPEMQRLEPRMERGFVLLDADHHALDPWLARLADEANAVLQGAEDRDAVGRFLTSLEAFGPLLARHLEDEEDLVVPVILSTGLG